MSAFAKFDASKKLQRKEIIFDDMSIINNWRFNNCNYAELCICVNTCTSFIFIQCPEIKWLWNFAVRIVRKLNDCYFQTSSARMVYWIFNIMSVNWKIVMLLRIPVRRLLPFLLYLTNVLFCTNFLINFISELFERKVSIGWSGHPKLFFCFKTFYTA